MIDLIQYAAEGVHKKILTFLEEFQKGWILDVPSGQGTLSYMLEKKGFKLFLGDIQRDNILYKNGRVIQIDLNTTLPF